MSREILIGAFYTVKGSWASVSKDESRREATSEYVPKKIRCTQQQQSATGQDKEFRRREWLQFKPGVATCKVVPDSS